MRNVFIGSAIGILLAATGYSVGPAWVFADIKRNLENKCGQFVDATVLAVTEQWDSREVIGRIDPKMLVTGDEGKMEKLFRLYRRLGDLVNYYGSTGQVYADFDPMEDSTVNFNYSAEADFENGSATIRVEGMREHGKFYILDFSISSEMFIDNL